MFARRSPAPLRWTISPLMPVSAPNWPEKQDYLSADCMSSRQGDLVGSGLSFSWTTSHASRRFTYPRYDLSHRNMHGHETFSPSIRVAPIVPAFW